MSRPRIVIIVLAATALGAAAYAGAWAYAAGQMRDAVAGWIAARRTEGWTVTHGAVGIEGFPFALRARIDRPVLERGGGEGLSAWRGPALTVAFAPWQPRRIALTAPGAHRIAGAWRGRDVEAAIDAGTARADIDVDDAGRASALAVHVGDARIAPAGGGPETAIGTLGLDLRAPQAPPDPALAPHQRPSLAIVAEAGDVDLPAALRTALGRRIQRLALTASVLGRIKGRTPKDALAAWRRDGGTVEVEHLALEWGALGVAADGTVALDEALQPEGALTARVTGFRETLDALATAGAVRPKDAMAAKVVLGLLARTPDGGGPPAITAAVTAQDGRLYVGPVPLLVLPPIRWD